MNLTEKYQLEPYKIYLQQYLKPESAIAYIRVVNYCMDYLGEQKTKKASYQDIMEYITYLRKKQMSSSVIYRQIASLKMFYNYLIESRYRGDHPCRNLQIKDYKANNLQLQDLFTSEELERLMTRKERFTKLASIRNKVIMSLFIYQALRAVELIELSIDDIDIEKGTVRTKGTAKTKARILPLKSSQVMLFYRYIHEIRPELLALSNEKRDCFILNLRGCNEGYGGIQYLIETFQHYFKATNKPNRKLTSVTIRQSVIANLLKDGKDIRLVQEFAGHLKLTSTAKYREQNLDELQSVVQKYHPLQ